MAQKGAQTGLQIEKWAGKHVAERKNEVVQVPMIVELALIVIKRGIRALRNSVQNPAHPLCCCACSAAVQVCAGLTRVALLGVTPWSRAAVVRLRKGPNRETKAAIYRS